MLLTRTLHLKNEPTGTLHSLDELFALANAMEKEAADCYADLAAEMRLQNRSDLAEVFAELSAAERGHVDSVARWSQSRLGRPPDPALVRWEAPETFDAETMAEIKASQLLTPYRALSTAVRNEERAFAFWSYVAAFTPDPEIKKAAEAMAREELGHVATLRKERRRSYHRERESGAGDRTRAAAGDGQVDAGVLERRLAELLAGEEERIEDVSRHRLFELREETKLMAADAAGLARFPASLMTADDTTIAEALVDGYLEGAERSNDAERLERLQSLAGRAISRLAWLRSLAAGTEPRRSDKD
ncbi:MAG: ferritin family protein [Bradyrhizobium sp.]|uniref:ferritin-like domain-containing protein n=1 Tax=Bradyrhizobium sp. TaxID=376 RepID=UPI0025C4BF15|nr:ferritin family protein [Bradyrhizobium sp.]MBI5261872.1 ferritin family protein [Bradyrhizobium sp.]